MARAGSCPACAWTCTGACERDQAALQPDGAIVLAQQSSLMRRLADGRLDTGFGAGGRVRIESGQVSGLAIAPDGRIIVAIALYPTGPVTLARYLPDGTRDGRFGIGGRRPITRRVRRYRWRCSRTDGSSSPATAWRSRVTSRAALPTRASARTGSSRSTSLNGEALALQPDGKIVVAGRRTGDTVVARFLADGRLDRQFGSDGVTGKTFMLSGIPRGMAVLSGGTVAVAGVIWRGSGSKSSGWPPAIVTPDGHWKTLSAPPPVPVRRGGSRCGRTSKRMPWPSSPTARCSSVAPPAWGRSSAASRPSLELDAGPPIRLAALARRGQLLRGSVDRSVLHVRGALRMSDAASITVSVRVKGAAPCRVRERLRLLPGTTLGTERLARSAYLMRSPPHAQACALGPTSRSHSRA